MAQYTYTHGARQGYKSVTPIAFKVLYPKYKRFSLANCFSFGTRLRPPGVLNLWAVLLFSNNFVLRKCLVLSGKRGQV